MIQLLISGLVTGSIYALVALGFSFIFKSTEAVNFSQGEWVMAGAMIAAALYKLGPGSLALAVPAAILAVTVLAVVFERLVVYPLAQPTPMKITLMMIGVAIITKALVMLTLGKAPAGLPGFSGNRLLSVGGVLVNPQALWVVGTLTAAMTLTHWFFEHTLAGRAMKAAASDRDAAALVGINVRRTVMWSFGLAGAVGALAGVIITPITMTSFNAGGMLGFKGFSAAILGGLGVPRGALAGGLLLGLLEALAAGYISSQYKDAVAFIVLLAVLFVRPTGLFGQREIVKV
ncbi:MAG: branched-chain amino acid ABC transporter permease [Pseudomonadota bacterium]|nr:branched-chain amino acid ABC transporter permease [Pseudomonadota bacterium]